MSFTWFPGHMRKALRRIEKDAQGVDVVLVLLDARMPATSRNTLLEQTLKQKGKSLVFVLHKTDLAEPYETRRWIDYLRQNGDEALAVSSTTGAGKNTLLAVLKTRHKKLVERAQKRGLKTDTLRAMMVGIPNVGKSTLINKLSGTGRAKAGKRPGLTRGPQYVWLSDGIELLDTPGVMLPGNLDDTALIPLAVTGTIREEVLPLDDLAPHLYALLASRHRLEIVLPGVPPGEAAEWCEALYRQKGFLLPGAEMDRQRGILYLLKGLREGRWGPMTLESAPRPAAPHPPEQS